MTQTKNHSVTLDPFFVEHIDGTDFDAHLPIFCSYLGIHSEMAQPPLPLLSLRSHLPSLVVVPTTRYWWLLPTAIPLHP